MSVKKGKRRADDPSAGGKRSAMGPEEVQRSETPDGPHGEAAAPAARRRRPPSLAEGAAAIAEAAKTLPEAPGVYRMLDEAGEALYVGKAAKLKRRVNSYAQIAKLPHRLQRMVAETATVEVVGTASEVEALLLESNLIKRLQPRYNVLLRDDKSFPYILIAEDHPFPQLAKHRGSHERAGAYYGPFASAGAVNRSITALEKAFLLRSCSDAVFASRSRPCLMFQIKRCSAPCVGRIEESDYGQLVRQARDFLAGCSREVQEQLAGAMQEAAERLDFETAARYRDRLRALAHVQAHQDINLASTDDADVLAAHQEGGQTCIQVFFFRAGRNYGNRAYFPSHDKTLEAREVLAAFLTQFYDNKPVPPLVLVSHPLDEQALLIEALSLKAGRKMELLMPQRGEKRQIMERALSNARDALARRLAESGTQRRLLDELGQRLGLEGRPDRIEVYDNSHIQGSDAYGAMIVASPEGFAKSGYRRFLIKGAAKPPANDPAARDVGAGRATLPAQGLAEDTAPLASPLGGFAPGDDYAMMREVLTRRFSRALKEDPERAGETWPDLVLIDGGRGQLAVASAVLADLGLSDIPVVAIAKGPERNAGRERIFLPDRPPILLEPRDPLLYFLQRLRDEAHRFAIGSHRLGRNKSRLTSVLDAVPGIGAKRKKALLLHFGSARAVTQAGVADLQAVAGISRAVAERIYAHFHRDG